MLRPALPATSDVNIGKNGTLSTCFQAEMIMFALIDIALKRDCFFGFASAL